MDEWLARMEAERLRGMPRWNLTTITPDHAPADPNAIPDLPVDIRAADHRRMIDELKDGGLTTWTATA